MWGLLLSQVDCAPCTAHWEYNYKQVNIKSTESNIFTPLWNISAFLSVDFCIDS